MISRKSFLKYSFLGSLFFKKSIRESFFPTIQSNPISFINEKGENFKINSFNLNKVKYVSLNDWATAICEKAKGDRYLYVEEKDKLVVVKNKQRIIFSPDNTFIKIDENFYQMFYPVRSIENELWINLDELIEIMSLFSTVNFNYNKDSRKLSYENKGFNITGIQFEEKTNGTLARIFTSEVFKIENIKHAIKRDRDKLYITIRNAIVNEKSIKSTKTAGLIKNTYVFQSDSSADIVIHLKNDISSDLVSLMIDEDSGDILVSFSAKLTKKQKNDIDSIPEKKEDISKKLEEEQKRYLIDTIVIDAGHGGKDPGAIGKLSRGKLYEKTVVLDIAKKIKTVINSKNPDIKVVLTRSKDEYVSLYQRGKIANNNLGKVFISLHCNGNNSSKANGFETYVLGSNKSEAAKKIAFEENKVIDLYEGKESKNIFSGLSLIRATMAQRAYVKHSFYLAEIVDEKVGMHMKSLSVKDRGVKQAPFYVLYGPSMPSILIEIGFITNKREVKILARRNDRTKIAQSISWAILEYKRDIDSTV